MRYRVLVSFIAIAEVSAMSGCKALNTPYTKQYETVSANPNHDSVTAEREHAKALKYLDCFEPDHPGKLAKAEIHLKKALVADVTYGPAHNSLGVVYMLQRNYYIAAWEFEYAAKLMPSNTEPMGGFASSSNHHAGSVTRTAWFGLDGGSEVHGKRDRADHSVRVIHQPNQLACVRLSN